MLLDVWFLICLRFCIFREGGQIELKSGVHATLTWSVGKYQSVCNGLDRGFAQMFAERIVQFHPFAVCCTACWWDVAGWLGWTLASSGLVALSSRDCLFAWRCKLFSF